MPTAAHSKKLRLDRARCRKLNGKNGFVAIPYSTLPARPNALLVDTVVQIIALFVCSLLRRK
jgi:hypothetical protein